MATLFVRHKVNDYDSWKRAYDEFAPLRKENGVMGASVHRDAGDLNTVIITHKLKDTNAATALVSSEELKAAMVEAGVAGPPEVWISEDVEQTAY